MAWYDYASLGIIPAAKYIGRGVAQTIGGQNYYDPKAAVLNQDQANQDLRADYGARNQQNVLLGRLNQQMDGQGPTVAGLQAQQGIAQALSNAGTQAANARGVSRGLALRSAIYGGQQAQQAANRDASLLRAQEQLSAQQQAGGVLQAMRGGDIQTRQASIDAAKADQTAQMQREELKTRLTEGNAGRAQKASGAVLSAVGGAIKGLSDIRAKENIAPAPMSFAERLSQQLRVDDAELQRRQEAESNAQISAALASPNASYGAQQAGVAQGDAAGLSPDGTSPVTGGGVGGAIGGGMEEMGQGLMSDRHSKERIRFLEAQLYGEQPRAIDRLDPNSLNSMTRRERSMAELPEEMRPLDTANPYVDSKANLKNVRPYEYSYRPEYARLIAQDTARRVAPDAQPAAAAAAYGDARAPRMGVMAQDLEKSPDGKDVVEDTPVGKVLDMKRSVAFALANQADLNRRLSKVERARR